MVAQILSLPTLGSSACVAWRRVLLPDEGFSKRHSLNLVRVLHVGIRVDPEAMWDFEWRHNVTIARDNFKHHDVDWILGLHHC